MIGPRPGRNGVTETIAARRGRTSAAADAGPSHGSSAPVAATVRSRSRNRGGEAELAKKAAKKKADKAFAWMDSEEESASREHSADRSASSRSSAGKEVPIEKVETLAQMARLAPNLEKRLRQGKLRSHELCEVVGALSRSKFFDPGLFGPLATELRMSIRRGRLSTIVVLDVVLQLADLNAYDQQVFEEACAVLRPAVCGLPDPSRQRLEAALKKVGHGPGDDFFAALREAKKDTREACSMFWRGQCKWGPKCKLSHDQTSFEESAKEGRWRPPSQSGGKSVGFKQSADLFKDDRCGALW